MFLPFLGGPYGVGKLEEPSCNGVARLVVSDRLLFLGRHDAGLALETGNDSFDCRLEMFKLDRLGCLACGNESRLVANVGNVGAREARGQRCQPYIFF